MEINLAAKRLVVVDLDGTLTKSKSPMDKEMADLVCKILNERTLAVISGGAYTQFQLQFLIPLSEKKGGIFSFSEKKADLSKLYLFPTCATSMYYLKNGLWERVYEETIDRDTKEKIIFAFKRALEEEDELLPKKTYGETLEDRGAEVTFSACGQRAPLDVKSAWDPDAVKRQEIIKHLAKYLPEGFQARFGGASSIDVTRKGIDYAYGINKIMRYLNFKFEEVLYVGRTLKEGSNGSLVRAEGFECMDVKDPDETKLLFKSIIATKPST